MTFGDRERPLVQPSRLCRPAAGEPHAGQDDGRTELVCDVAGRMQARDRRAERVHGGAGVAGGPRGQAEEAGGGPAGEMVVRPGQLQCVAGVRNGAVDVAAGLGD